MYRVEISPVPLHCSLAYTTACSTVQAVIIINEQMSFIYLFESNDVTMHCTLWLASFYKTTKRFSIESMCIHLKCLIILKSVDRN